MSRGQVFRAHKAFNPKLTMKKFLKYWDSPVEQKRRAKLALYTRMDLHAQDQGQED